MDSALGQAMPMAEFRHVDVVFGKHSAQALALLDAGKTRQEILDATGAVLGAADCSLKIAEGEISVLMGLSGSGKSTLLRCLNGLNTANRGAVMVRDTRGAHGDYVDLTRCDAATLRRLRTTRVAMVFQQFALLPWRTVSENVGLGLELSGMAQAQRETIVAEKLELVGLQQWGKKYAHELSGGMQQRVGLARAFATDADILLMDEPFSALDPLIREHLQQELLQLQKQLKKTIVFVSHDLDEAIKLGDHITIMEGGRIVQSGEPEQVVLHPANAYVRDFVAHMNPIKVLRARSLMAPLSALPRDGDRLQLDWTGHHWLQIDAAHRPAHIDIEGRPGQLLAYHPQLDIVQAGLDGRSVAMVSPDLLLEHIIHIRHATGRPVLLCEGERFVGVVGDEEIYRGMLQSARG
ncbi:MAG: choline ABC transporter ATP-binding protein [Betaproteobacteria bacterium]